jgi:septal ring factor EnvC (AmiA/AmiB activator)
MYVFGIDLPIMELLFVFGVFYLAALLIIWLELKKLGKLISTEEKDITRFEKDIKKGEKDIDRFEKGLGKIKQSKKKINKKTKKRKTK